MRNFITIVESAAWPQTITPDMLIDWTQDNHHTPEDIGDGDLYDRVWAFQRYTLERIPLSSLNLDEWMVHDDLVADYRAELANGEAPPIVYDSVNHSIIDGTHRANAAAASGATDILAYVGDAATYEAPAQDEDDD